MASGVTRRNRKGIQGRLLTLHADDQIEIAKLPSGSAALTFLFSSWTRRSQYICIAGQAPFPRGYISQMMSQATGQWQAGLPASRTACFPASSVAGYNTACLVCQAGIWPAFLPGFSQNQTQTMHGYKAFSFCFHSLPLEHWSFQHLSNSFDSVTNISSEIPRSAQQIFYTDFSNTLIHNFLVF